MKRFISLALCFLMIINIFPVTAFAEEEQSLEEIIRPQVEAFAKSIDQKNADGKAQDILISHGIRGNGKKLSVGKSSALTATLINSGLVKEALPFFCAKLLEARKEYDTEEIYCIGDLNWKITETNCGILFYDHKPEIIHKQSGANYPSDFFKTIGRQVEKPNQYDSSLKWIVGGALAEFDLGINKIYDDKIVYDVNVVFCDAFNFDTDNRSTLENLLGFIGIILFNPFEWEAKCNFQIEIPIEKPEENEVFGDFDGSGEVEVADAYFARLVAAKLVVPTEEQLAFCDVDSDGKITAIDANLIRKFAAGIIKELPVK